MGDCLRAGTPPWYVTKPTRSTHPCIPPGSLNEVPALIGWDKDGNITSAGWQVTICDPIWHVSSRDGEVSPQTSISSYFSFTLLQPIMNIIASRCRMCYWYCLIAKFKNKGLWPWHN